jgi:hypothetical protein
MKINRLKIYVKLVFLGILVGCQEDNSLNPEWPATGWGEVTVLRNGVSWSKIKTIGIKVNNLITLASCNGFISVQFSRYNKEGYLREILTFDGVAPDELRSYQILSRYKRYNEDCGNGSVYATYGTLEDDGDVSKSSFLFDESKPHFLEITHVDTTNHTISGNFSATFIKRPEFINDDPDTVRFVNGKFSTPITDKSRFL